MRLFRWLSAQDIPPGCDLRRLGWVLADEATPLDEIGQCPALAPVDILGNESGIDFSKLRGRPLPRQVMLLGVEEGDRRAQLLQQGFGDALGSSATMTEIEARALRIAEYATALPRARDLGRLRLDLFARDGFVGHRPLGLHPREFALIWRLAETPGLAVAKSELVSDVWRMSFMPDTNSVAVHVFRLRAKLAIAGLEGIVQTAPSGGYFLAPASVLPNAMPFMLADAGGLEPESVHLSAGYPTPVDADR